MALPKERSGIPKWVLWSNRASINNEIPSVTAIIETILAVPIYWWVAIHYETYLPLLVSVVVAPLVLLRSDESVALGVKWFRAWDRGVLSLRETWREALRRHLIAGALLAFLTYASAVLTFDYFRMGLQGGGWTAVWSGFAAVAVPYVVSLGILVAVTAPMLGVAAFILITPAIIIFSTLGFAGAYWYTKPTFSYPASLAIFLISISAVPFGYWTVSIVIRMGATLRHVAAGVLSVPRNFRRLTICTSPLQQPELVPGLTPGETEFFTLTDALQEFRRSVRSDKLWKKQFAFTLLTTAIPLWFAPAWLYRITLKSTAWFWWPLALLGGELRRAKDPIEFRRKIIGSLWAKTSIALAAATIVVFLFANFVWSGVVFKDNPLLTVFGYFLIVDWSPRSWQVFVFVIAVLSLAIVFLVDDVSGEFHRAKEKGDHLLRAHAERKFGWIERLVRFRFLLVVIFWLLVGAHTLLYFNGLECWFALPSNANHWAQWIYGERLPRSICGG